MSEDVYWGAFVWDSSKNQTNILRHGLSFEDAVAVFRDPRCLILEDPAHSLVEERFFCVGRLGSKIGTVRFTYRHGRVRIIGAGYWRKGKKFYENKKTFEEEDGPSRLARVIPNFLPPPEELFPVEDTLKITLRLDRQSVDFYKERAKRHGTKYQRMMREILKRYALHHLSNAPPHSLHRDR